ncbi:hypothetical protein AC1031_011399 [Aphanomyces cochlioides]|nr:hypothetical protein AC1031_011399 [Aphanomyces cochlioides]
MENSSLLLPSDIVVKIAFLLQDWKTVTTLLEALHSANALGPLEHLWHLHFRLEWNEKNLWPSLNLRKMDETSRIHVEGIVKYYTRVAVDSKTDLAWFRQFGHLMKSIEWMEQTDTLGEWKSFRITSLLSIPYQPDQLTQAFDDLPYLEEVACFNCTARLGEIICNYVATSSSLQRIYLCATDQPAGEYTTITKSMGNDLLKCIRPQPIKVFNMENFTWESTEMRDQVVRSVLSNPALQQFTFNEHDDVESLAFEVHVDRTIGSMTWKFYGRFSEILGDWSNLDGFLRLFLPLLETEVKQFKVIEPNEFGMQRLCAILNQSLQQSKVAELILGPCFLSNRDASSLARTIRDISTLQVLTLDGRLTFEGAKEILTAAPPSLKSNAITVLGAALTHCHAFNEQERVELKNICRRTDTLS